MNLVLLACLLKHPSLRLAGSVEANAACQLGGSGRGEGASHGEEAARWRWARQTGPGWECGAEEAAWRRPQGMGHGATLRGTGRGEAEWGGKMGMATQGGNDTASVGAHGAARAGVSGEIEASVHPDVL
jgi:hypothetical protein